jgi:5-methylcytosine-specific restriction endonuclease McrA
MQENYTTEEQRNLKREFARRRKYDRRKMKRARERGAMRVKFVGTDWVRKRDNDTCYLCGGFVSIEDASLDHVIPISRGGDHTRGNVKLAHGRCNSLKGDKLLSELDSSIFFAKVA